MTAVAPDETTTALAYCTNGCGWRECRRYYGRWLCLYRCWRRRQRLLAVIQREKGEA